MIGAEESFQHCSPPWILAGGFNASPHGLSTGLRSYDMAAPEQVIPNQWQEEATPQLHPGSEVTNHPSVTFHSLTMGPYVKTHLLVENGAPPSQERTVKEFEDIFSRPPRSSHSERNRSGEMRGVLRAPGGSPFLRLAAPRPLGFIKHHSILKNKPSSLHCLQCA